MATRQKIIDDTEWWFCKILTVPYASWRESHEMRYAGLSKDFHIGGAENTSTASGLQIIDGHPDRERWRARQARWTHRTAPKMSSRTSKGYKASEDSRAALLAIPGTEPCPGA